MAVSCFCDQCGHVSWLDRSYGPQWSHFYLFIDVCFSTLHPVRVGNRTAL